MSDDPTDEKTTEQKMRSAFEARRGAPFTEEEWEEAKRNLVGLMLMFGTRDATPSDN